MQSEGVADMKAAWCEYDVPDSTQGWKGAARFEAEGGVDVSKRV